MTPSITWSRAEPMSLRPAARAMYEQGRTRSEVLRAIYGVELPSEALLVLRDLVSDVKPLDVTWRLNPWDLMVPPSPGEPELKLSPQECAEDARAYAQAPHVILVGRLGYIGAPLARSLVGYDINELREGRSTIVGVKNVPRLPADPVPFTIIGPSLLDVLCEVVAPYVALIKQRNELDGHQDVDTVVEELAWVEELRREFQGK